MTIQQHPRDIIAEMNAIGARPENIEAALRTEEARRAEAESVAARQEAIMAFAARTFGGDAKRAQEAVSTGSMMSMGCLRHWAKVNGCFGLDEERAIEFLEAIVFRTGEPDRQHIFAATEFPILKPTRIEKRPAPGRLEEIPFWPAELVLAAMLHATGIIENWTGNAFCPDFKKRQDAATTHAAALKDLARAYATKRREIFGTEN